MRYFEGMDGEIEFLRKALAQIVYESAGEVDLMQMTSGDENFELVEYLKWIFAHEIRSSAIRRSQVKFQNSRLDHLR